MRQLHLFDYYVLGKALESLFEVNSATLKTEAGFSALAVCREIKEAMRPDSVFLPSTKRAAATLVKKMVLQFGEGIDVGLPVFWNPYQESEATLGDDAEKIVEAAREFETIFRNDSPGMSVFCVGKKGIYRTEDLIENSEDHLPDSLRGKLPAQAKLDLTASGRCLAFEVPTASAFHMWRALEVVFGEYYKRLTGNAFEDAHPKISRNWGAYIKALDDAGADRKITGNLDHIRAEYRNPIMHPSENVAPDEAFGLFGVGISAITQVLHAL